MNQKTQKKNKKKRKKSCGKVHKNDICAPTIFSNIVYSNTTYCNTIYWSIQSSFLFS